ncbi:MAG: hypothetical protein WC057_05445 [Dehalococcoidales bacterium]
MSKPRFPTVLYLEGIDTLLKNKDRANVKIGRAVEKGLLAGGVHLRKKSLEIVPVQIGNLHGSAYPPRNVGGRGLRADVVVGYTAEYAPWVHEIPSPRVTHGKEFNIKHAAEIAAAVGTPLGTAKGGMFLRKPEEQWKFLEKPMKTERKNIFKIIGNYIRAVR